MTSRGRDRGWIVVAAVVVVGLLLRLWGVGWGLPFAYNLDERSHFLPRSIAMLSSGTLDPAYQLNPSGLIEYLAAVLAVVKGGPANAVATFRDDPGQVWLIARIASALLSTLALVGLYVAGRRLFDRWVGVVAAAILATSVLPVAYGHLALNDGPSLAPTTLALIGIAGIVRGPTRRRDYLLAGAGLGAAIAIKYNAGFVLLPLLTAAVVHASRERRAALVGVPVAGAAALAAFAVLDPYALLHFGFFRDEVDHLSDYAKGTLLLGETQRSGVRYYAWTLLWGFGVIPLLLAAVGSLSLIRRDRPAALILIPAPLVFYAYIGAQGRYFARYGMPVYPVLALLAGAGAVALARKWGPLLLARARTPRRPTARVLLVAGVLVVCGQGLVWSLHNGWVLSHEDTRSATRRWMVANVPAGTSIAVEPLVPKEWYADGARLRNARSQRGYRWRRFVRTGADKRLLARQYPRSRLSADFANYGFTLFPGLLDFYRRRGVCWIVSGSGQSGRVFNDPGRVPAAVRYYRALDRQADLRYRIAPFDGPGAEHFFQYDLLTLSIPLKLDRPGPTMRVYRLRRCRPA